MSLIYKLLCNDIIEKSLIFNILRNLGFIKIYNKLIL